MLQGDLAQPVVAGGVGRVQDQADVHHHVDEQRLRANKRRQIATRLASQCQRAAGLDQRVPAARIAGQVVLAEEGGKEQESEVVDRSVVLPFLQRPRQFTGGVGPPRLARVPVQ